MPENNQEKIERHSRGGHALIRRPAHLKGLSPKQVREYIVDVLEGTDCDPFLNLALIATNRAPDGISTPVVQVVGGKDRDEVIELEGYPPDVILAANKELANYIAPKYKGVEVQDDGASVPTQAPVIIFAGNQPGWTSKPRPVVDVTGGRRLEERREGGRVPLPGLEAVCQDSSENLPRPSDEE